MRYADDCLIMIRSEKAANRVMESITTFITKKLGLKVNAEKSKIARPDNIKYLGFGFYKKVNQNIWRPKPHVKSKMKIAGQFQNEQNAKYYADIKTYIETCYRNNINPTDALIMLMEDKPYAVSEIFDEKKD